MVLDDPRGEGSDPSFMIPHHKQKSIESLFNTAKSALNQEFALTHLCWRKGSESACKSEDVLKLVLVQLVGKPHQLRRQKG